jgi:hypothetical protein
MASTTTETVGKDRGRPSESGPRTSQRTASNVGAASEASATQTSTALYRHAGARS